MVIKGRLIVHAPVQKELDAEARKVAAKEAELTGLRSQLVAAQTAAADDAVRGETQQQQLAAQQAVHQTMMSEMEGQAAKDVAGVQLIGHARNNM